MTNDDLVGRYDSFLHAIRILPRNTVLYHFDCEVLMDLITLHIVIIVLILQED